eukprot:g2881.t1
MSKKIHVANPTLDGEAPPSPQLLSRSRFKNKCLEEDEILLGWGYGDDGRIGSGRLATELAPLSIQNPLQKQRIRKLCAGVTHTVALSTSFTVFTWGFGANGQLGHGSDVKQAIIPKAVEGLANYKVMLIAAGYYHTLAAIDSGNSYSWGMGKDGQLGQGEEEDEDLFEPEEILLLKDCRAKILACGGYHSGIKTEKKFASDTVKIASVVLQTFGAGSHGQLGHGDLEPRFAPTPCEATKPNPLGQQGIDRVEFGGFHSAMYTSNGYAPGHLQHKGGLWLWGCGGDGQQAVRDDGRGRHLDDVLVPTKNMMMSGAKVFDFSLGHRHTIVSSITGSVYTFGNGRFGQLGHGNCDDLHDPVYFGHGVNAHGRLEWVLTDEPNAGVEATRSAPSSPILSSAAAAGKGRRLLEMVETHQMKNRKPSRVSVKIVAVSAGAYHSMMLDERGRVYSWGLPTDGRLGHGDVRGEFLLDMELDTPHADDFAWKEEEEEEEEDREKLVLVTAEMVKIQEDPLRHEKELCAMLGLGHEASGYGVGGANGFFGWTPEAQMIPRVIDSIGKPTPPAPAPAKAGTIAATAATSEPRALPTVGGIVCGFSHSFALPSQERPKLPPPPKGLPEHELD